MLQNNIVIDENGQARLTDTKINALVLSIVEPDSSPKPSFWAYKSPEGYTTGRRGTPRDVYAFATTIYSVSAYVLSPF